jgi:CDP-glycerol glycerophosphotransferase (TagB/SpsB family)
VLNQLHSYVNVGNYRYLYYKKYRQHFDQLAEKKIFSFFKKKSPCILYAPTWVDYDNASTFSSFCSPLIERLPDAYNLIIKVHPRLRTDNENEYAKISNECAHRSNIILVDQFPLIYPILAKTDIYVGDASSIGYDFLTFNKPMYFLNKLQRDPLLDRRAYLMRCGTIINPEDFDNLFPLIENTLPTDMQNFQEIRSQVYAYTFGDERPFEKIKDDILSAVQHQANPI